MFTRSKALAGITAAALLATGAAWASNETTSEAGAEATVAADLAAASTTVVQVDEAGTVTLGQVAEGLTILAVDAEAGWTATVEVPLGREVEARFESDATRIDFNAELEDGEIRLRMDRTNIRGSVTSSTETSVTPSPDAPSTTAATSTTSTTVDSPTTSSISTTSSTSTTSTTSTTVDDNRRRSEIPEGVQVYEVLGAGSVTVDIRSGLLILLDVDVESGWTFEIDKAEVDDIRVEFEGANDAEAELRVRIRDGRLEVRRD